MKPIIKQFLVPTLSALFGGLVVYGAIKIQAPRHQNKQAGYADIFKKHDEMKSQFDQLMNENIAHSEDLFDSWFSRKFDFESLNEISKREDDSAVYYEIKVDDIKSTSIKTKVENGYITITGTTEKTNDDSRPKDDGMASHSVFKSSFNRTFPLPENIDQNKMQMSSETNKIILKFPKVKV